MFSLRIRIRTQITDVIRQALKPCCGSLEIQRRFLRTTTKSSQQITLLTAIQNFQSSLWEHNVRRRYAEKSEKARISTVPCWNCNKIIEHENQMLCMECGHLQDVNTNINFFKLLDLPQKFDIESQELTKRFRQLQAIVHPDKYSNKSEREQTNSAEWSSLINKAYKTLAKPIERGQYLLQLNGQSIPQDNSALDKEFLMEMMERNEEVEDSTTADDLRRLDERIIMDMKNDIKQLNAAFDENDMKAAKEILVKMKYLLSVQQSIKTKMQSSMS